MFADLQRQICITLRGHKLRAMQQITPVFKHQRTLYSICFEGLTFSPLRHLECKVTNSLTQEDRSRSGLYVPFALTGGPPQPGPYSPTVCLSRTWVVRAALFSTPQSWVNFTAHVEASQHSFAYHVHVRVQGYFDCKSLQMMLGCSPLLAHSYWRDPLKPWRKLQLKKRLKETRT